MKKFFGIVALASVIIAQAFTQAANAARNCSSTFCRAETRSDRRRNVSKAGMRLSTSSRSRARSGVVWSAGF